MTEPLTFADIERMRQEHRDDGLGSCWKCWRDAGDPLPRPWPCDAARLLEYIAATDPSTPDRWWPESTKNVERMLAHGWVQVDGGIGGTVYVPEDELPGPGAREPQ